MPKVFPSTTKIYLQAKSLMFSIKKPKSSTFTPTGHLLNIRTERHVLVGRAVNI